MNRWHDIGSLALDAIGDVSLFILKCSVASFFLSVAIAVGISVGGQL